MLGSPTIYEPIIASMCNSSCEDRNQNILFFTRRIFTFFFGSLSRRFIILYSVSMMSFIASLLLVRATFVSRKCSRKVSFLVTCIASDFRQISAISFRVIFLVRMLTFGIMIVLPYFIGVYCERLIFTSHIFFSEYYSSFFLWEFLPRYTEVPSFLLAQIPWMKESHGLGRPFKVVITISAFSTSSSTTSSC